MKENLIITPKKISFTMAMVKLKKVNAVVLLNISNLPSEKMEVTERVVKPVDISEDILAAKLYSKPDVHVYKMRVDYWFGHPDRTICRVYKNERGIMIPKESWSGGFPRYENSEGKLLDIYVKKELKKKLDAWGIQVSTENSGLLLNPFTGLNSEIKRKNTVDESKEKTPQQTNQIENKIEIPTM